MPTAQHVPNARALENHVYFMAVNRVGTERGFCFIGHSKICDVHGNTVSEANSEDQCLIYADIDPQLARDKHIVRVPGKYELDRLADRRPEMYEWIVRDRRPRSRSD
jgi:predicted amidohydrolase